MCEVRDRHCQATREIKFELAARDQQTAYGRLPMRLRMGGRAPSPQNLPRKKLRRCSAYPCLSATGSACACACASNSPGRSSVYALLDLELCWLQLKSGCPDEFVEMEDGARIETKTPAIVLLPRMASSGTISYKCTENGRHSLTNSPRKHPPLLNPLSQLTLQFILSTCPSPRCNGPKWLRRSEVRLCSSRSPSRPRAPTRSLSRFATLVFATPISTL